MIETRETIEREISSSTGASALNCASTIVKRQTVSARKSANSNAESKISKPKGNHDEQ